MGFQKRAKAGLRKMINRLKGRVTINGQEVKCGVFDHAEADVMLAGGGGDGTRGDIALVVMKDDVQNIGGLNTDADVLYKGEQISIKTIAGADDPDNPALTIVIGDENVEDDEN